MYPEKYSPNPNFFSNINENFKLNDNYVSNTIIPSYNITNFYNYSNNRDLSTKNANESITNNNIQSSIDKNKQIGETEKILNFNINNYNNLYFNIFSIPILPLPYLPYIYYQFNNFDNKCFEKKCQINKEKKKWIPFSIKKVKKIKNKREKKSNRKSYSSRQDNDRVKFVRQTLNFYLYNKLTNIIKLSKIKQKLKKFPEKLINEIAKINNKKYLNLTLEDFYTRRELYNSKELLKHFEYNLVIINHLKDEKNKIFLEKYGVEALLKMKFIDLIRIYLQSEQFQQKINELNENKGAYLSEKFKYFANNFINNYLD